MLTRLLSFPLILVLSAVAALMMLLPMLDGLMRGDQGVARAFGASSVLGLALVVAIGLSISGRQRRDKSDFSNLVSLFMAYLVLPVFLAVPFYEALGTTSFLNAYLEMVSAITTTGLPIFNPERLGDSLHLYRGLVAWLGGLFLWIAAAAILAPMKLGGFEITANAEPGQTDTNLDRFQRATAERRLLLITLRLAPVYIALTGALWIMLMLAGERALVAAVHGMSIMATSGISPVGGIENGVAGIGGEMVMFLFLFFALSRLTFSSDTRVSQRASIFADPEFRLAMVLVAITTLILFARHWTGAFEVDDTSNLSLALRALWGAAFTALSFLTTTGFQSADWTAAQNWSGLGTPGLILLALSLVGGGLATTAGGVKLLRIYALYLNGQRELQRLVHPSSVGPSGLGNRRMRRDGAYVAWLFFMVFAMSLAVVTALFAVSGQGFEAALILTISALSTTGPLVAAAAETPIRLLELTPGAKFVLCGAMVLGRIEALAIFALFNPQLWRE